MAKKKFYTYLLLFSDNENPRKMFFKVGETSNLDRRISELEKTYDAFCTYISALYVFDTEEKALTMENVIRSYCKEKKYTRFIPKDRFKGRYPTTADINAFNAKAEEVITLFTEHAPC